MLEIGSCSDARASEAVVVRVRRTLGVLIMNRLVTNAIVGLSQLALAADKGTDAPLLGQQCRRIEKERHVSPSLAREQH